MSVTPAMQCWEHGCKEGCRLPSQLYSEKDQERQTNNKAETDSVHTHRSPTLRQHISDIAIYYHYRHASGSVNDLEETSEQDSYEDLCVH